MKATYFEDTNALTLDYDRTDVSETYTVPVGDDVVLTFSEDGRVLSVEIMFDASTYTFVRDLLRRGDVERVAVGSGKCSSSNRR